MTREELPAAGALSSLRGTGGMIAGPAVGGALIATVGLATTYAFDVATFVFSLAMLSLMRAVPPPADAERPSLRGIVEGVRYPRSRPELLGTYGVGWNQTIPDRLRGRLAGIEQVSYSTGPLLGNVEAGAVGSLAGLRASIVSGGLLCVAGVAVAVACCRRSGATTPGSSPLPRRAPRVGRLREVTHHIDPSQRSAVRIEAWDLADLPLLEKLLGDPAMTQHLGGPESPEKIAERNARYARPESRMFKIVDEVTGEGVGSVGYWEREWRGELVYETGWSVLPAFQGRGIAAAATELAIASARSERKHRYLHAFPSIANAPSNALCRKLGFTLVEECQFEYPKDSGSFMRCNDWRLDLFASC